MKKTDKLHKEIAECAYDDFEVGKEAYTKEKYLNRNYYRLCK